MLTFFFPTEKERTYFFGAADVVCGFIPRPIHINTSMIKICFIFLFMCFPPLRCPAPFCYRLILAYFPVPVYTVSHVTKIVTPSSCCFFFSETLSVFILLFLWFFPQDVSDFQSTLSLYRKILCKTKFSFCLAKDFLLFFLIVSSQEFLFFCKHGHLMFINIHLD